MLALIFSSSESKGRMVLNALKYCGWEVANFNVFL